MRAVYGTLIVGTLFLAHLLFGGGDGTRLVYVLPAYLLVGLVGLITITSAPWAKVRIDRGCLLAVTTLGGYILLRVAFSPVAYLASFDFFAALGALLIYFIMALFVAGRWHRIAIVCSLLVLSLVQVAIGVYQFARDASFNPFVTDGRADASFRASGLFISPNHLGGFLEVTLILGTSICLWGGFRVLGRIILGYLTLVCLAGLVLTGSRGGYLSATAGMVVFAGLSVWTARASMSETTGRRLVGIVVALVLLGGTLTAIAKHSIAIRERTNIVFVSKDIRLSLWDAAWKQFSIAPVFGTGSRTYAYYGRTFRGPEVYTDPVFAHSDWLQALAEYGIVGIVLIAAFVFAHLRNAWTTWYAMLRDFSPALSSPGEKNALALQIGIISAIVACLVHAVLDFNLHIPANMLLTASLFGMLATSQTEPIEKPKGWLPRLPYVIPAVLGLWMLIVGGRKFPGELFAETARGKFATGQVGAAVEDAGQALAWGARNPELHFQIGEAQRIMSKRHRSEGARTAALEEARDAYGEAVAIYPKDVKLVLREAWALDRLGQFEEAEALFSTARELDPNSVTVWAFSALHWHLQNKPAEALADYRKAFKLGGGLVPLVLAEVDEKLDPQELEKAAAK